MFKINDIIEFFGTLSDSTSMYVTNIEVKPIKVKGNLYVTGFKRCGLGEVEVHIKEMNEINIPTNTTTLKVHSLPNNDIWMPTAMLSDETLSLAFNHIKKRFYSLKSYEVANLKYRLKTANKSDYIMIEEAIVFEDKTQACREAIQRRKYCETFKCNFFHFGEKTETKKLTDLEFAEAAL